MNFSFMIIILLIILLFFSLKNNNKFLFFLMATFIILLLNEIYNFKDFNSEKYYQQPVQTESILQEYNENYKFNDTLDVYQQAINKGRTEYADVEVPQSPFLKKGMQCALEKKILDNNLKLAKLKHQDGYAGYILQWINGELVEWDDTNPNVFNPIFNNQLTKDKECPTVCHIIDDSEKCRTAKNIPTFNNFSEFRDWKNNTINLCDSLSRNECNNNLNCRYDTIDRVCRYDKRKCLSHMSPDNIHECHKRCSYFSEDEDGNLIEKKEAKLNCESAKLMNGTPYCRWNTSKQGCEPICDFYNESTCDTDPRCRFNNGKCETRPGNC